MNPTDSTPPHRNHLLGQHLWNPPQPNSVARLQGELLSPSSLPSASSSLEGAVTGQAARPLHPSQPGSQVGLGAGFERSSPIIHPITDNVLGRQIFIERLLCASPSAGH